MVKNSSNRNKVNHLTSDLKSLNKKKTTTFFYKDPSSGLGQAQNVVGLNRWDLCHSYLIFGSPIAIQLTSIIYHR